jgi:hypothetical protein
VRKSFHSFTSYLLIYHSIQTLKTLDLRYNDIGDLGVQYLVDALENNTVRLTHDSFIFVFYFIIYNTDTHDIRS